MPGVDKPLELEPFTLEERVIIELSRQFFWFFLDYVFIRSFDGQTFEDDEGKAHSFEFGNLHREWAVLAQYYPRLCVMAPRAHLKSTVLGKAFAFWNMFRVDNGELVDMLYFSYKANLAAEQVEELLRLIRANPYCRFWKDLKPYGRTMIDFLVDFGDGVLGEGMMKGEGIMAATRGRHPKVTICDDILSDFSNPLSSLDMEKIGRVFRQAIMSLPANPGDPLVLVGTPQSYEDILHELASLEDWMWLSYPAIMDEGNEIVQWPEKFTFGRLKQIQRNLGPTAFEVEFQLTPISVSDQFFTRDDILSVTDMDLELWDLHKAFDKADLATYGGFDVGKQVHPSHVSIFLELPNGTLVQIYEKFLDQMHYDLQVKMLNRIAEVFQISRGYYDATFNVLDDRGLAAVWRGRTFNRNLKASMAVLFEKRVFANTDEPGIILINDPRQLRSIVSMDKELKGINTVDGHSDSFWSCALSITAANDGPGIVEIGSPMLPIRDKLYEPNQTWVRQLGVR